MKSIGNNIKKTATAALIAAMITGCASGGHYQTRQNASAIYGGEVQRTSAQAVQRQQIRLPSADSGSRRGGLESMISNSHNNKSSVRDRARALHYERELEAIDGYVRNSYFTKVKDSIHSGVKGLRNERFQMRDDYLKQFMDYSYVKTDHVSAKYEERRVFTPVDLVGAVLSAPFKVVDAVLDEAIYGGRRQSGIINEMKEDFSPRTQRKMISPSYVRQVRVFPYSGREMEIGRK